MPLVTGETGGENQSLPHTEVRQIAATVENAFIHYGYETVMPCMTDLRTREALAYPADHLNIETIPVVTQPLEGGGTRYIMAGRTRPFNGSVDNLSYRRITALLNRRLLATKELQSYFAGVEVSFAQDIYPDPARNDLIIIIRIRDPHRLQGDGTPNGAVGDSEFVVAHSVQRMNMAEEREDRHALIDLFFGLEAEGISPRTGGVLSLMSRWPNIGLNRRTYVKEGIDAFRRVMARLSRICGENYIRIADETATKYNLKAPPLDHNDVRREQRHIMFPGLSRQLAGEIMGAIFGVIALSELPQGILDGVDEACMYRRSRRDGTAVSVFDRMHEMFRAEIARITGVSLGGQEVYEDHLVGGTAAYVALMDELSVARALPGVDFSSGSMQWFNLYRPVFRTALRRTIMRGNVDAVIEQAGMHLSTDIMARFNTLYALTMLDFVRTLNRMTQLLLPDGRRIGIYPSDFNPTGEFEEYEGLQRYLGMTADEVEALIEADKVAADVMVQHVEVDA